MKSKGLVLKEYPKIALDVELFCKGILHKFEFPQFLYSIGRKYNFVFFCRKGVFILRPPEGMVRFSDEDLSSLCERMGIWVFYTSNPHILSNCRYYARSWTGEV